MDWFHSTYINRIDRKGRVSVPADFRAVLARRGSGRLVLYPSVYVAAIDGAPEDFLEDINRRMEALDPLSQERDDLIDSILPVVQSVACDSEGRVILPEGLIAHAGLRESVAFVGRGPGFQIWEPDSFRARQAEARERTRGLRAAAGGG